MTETANPAWAETNRRYLAARIAAARFALATISRSPDDEGLERPGEEVAALAEWADETERTLTPKPSLDRLCAAFELSPFERDVLVLCAGMAVDPSVASLCAAAHGDQHAACPTFALARAAFEGEDWTAMTPAGPLRKWRLVHVGRGDTLLTSPLRIDESVLHHLMGTPSLDEICSALVTLVPVPESLPPSSRPAAERIAEMWTRTGSERPILHLTADVRGGERPLAAAACAALGLRLYAVCASDIPANPVERDAFIRTWEREAVLGRCALLVEFGDLLDPQATAAARAFAERVDALLMVSGAVHLDRVRQPVVRVEIGRPTGGEQRALWLAALGPLAQGLNGELDAVAAQFSLDPDGIRSVAEAVRGVPAGDPAIGTALWDSCRKHARRALDGLAERVETRAGWDDLVLPDDQRQTLIELTTHVRHRPRVYDAWGFAEQHGRGLGISALFTGPSGCGKTMAASIIAASLNLDLYVIDLSQVVSKYIGETEKALRRLFDAAEVSGAVLLFDEADALFGKRSEIRDSHDRYANVEVSYLLQRMDSYRGLAILTTNRRSALDAAFLRRLRFIVTFPFPDAAQRARIWERVFPPQTPTEGLEVQKLARLNVTGGSIRNIAMNAAFLAAAAAEPVRMTHLLRTARSECAKLEKPIATAEVGGWA